MKRLSFIILLLLLLAAEGAAAQEAGTAAESAVQTAVLSDDWADFQIQIDGTVYQFPMMYEEFLSLGWTADEGEEEIDPYNYTACNFTQGDVTCIAYVLNLGLNTEPYSNCIVAGIDIDNFYWDISESEIILPGGLIGGVSGLKETEAAYGTPSDTYEDDLYTKYTYQYDYNRSIDLYIYKESGVIEEITVKNFVAPDGYDEGEASEEVPEAVTAYAKPEALSNDLADYQIEIDGEIYELPVPVSVLAADGWALDTESSDSVIRAGYYGWVTLRKGGQSITEIAMNPERYATIPENCWIETLEVGGYTLDATGSLPGGISPGMTEEEFLNVLDGAGMTYELDESGDYRYYTYNERSYDQCIEVTVYAGDDGYFEQDTVMSITCSSPCQ